MWRCDAPFFNADEPVEYKYVVLNEHDAADVRWQAGNNRVVTVPGSLRRVLVSHLFPYDRVGAARAVP